MGTGEVMAENTVVEDIVMLDPTSLEFQREHGTLRMRRAGAEEWTEVKVSRLYPLSEQERWISVADSDDKEIGIVRDLHGLSRVSLACVREELRQRYMIPEIRKIFSCKDRFDLLEWEVETDRGQVRILMRHPQESIKQPISGHIALTDVEGNRYDIPDLGMLDKESRAWIEMRL
ncbi:MAG TPA: DUF1854 domain-containing protein [Armatimonadota bacterium]|nr:DUF1854 domain-containing protein [Armatimonadota bacterium]